MKYFVVRHIPTGNILPNMGRGSTHWDPTGINPPRKTQRKNAPPRLFTRESDADHFVSWWEEGTWTADYDSEGQTDGLSVKAKPERLGTLEVVPAELTIILEKS